MRWYDYIGLALTMLIIRRILSNLAALCVEMERRLRG